MRLKGERGDAPILIYILMPVVGLCAIMATLLVFTFQAVKSHEGLEGHPGVLRITAELKSQVDSLNFQASENRRKIAIIEAKVDRLAVREASMGQAVKGMDTIPTIISRVSTLEAEMKAERETRISEMIHSEGGGKR